jgi:glyoxylase-like metal-dependent hydrolase (beta-lactamase superfamily II)
VSREEVTTLVLTHLDFDHAGGALAGTWPDAVEPAFPHLVLSAVEFGMRRPTEPDEWDTCTRVIAAYRDAGRLEQAAPDTEFRPGLRLVAAPGHSPGHSVLLIGDELVLAADIFHVEEHVESPEGDGWADSDPALALATRLSWLERLAQEQTPVVFSHFERRGRILPGYHWAPDE